MRNLGIECPLSVCRKNSWEHSIMWEDPIVAAVHRAREKIAADCNFDVATFFAGVRKRQASLGARLIPQKTEPNQRL